MITRISTYLVEHLTNKGTACSEEDREVYIYGMECFFNKLFPIIFLSIWGLCTHRIPYVFVWIICFSLLRSYSGGYHAHSQFSCIFMTTSLGIISTAKQPFPYYENMTVIILLAVSSFILFVWKVPIINVQKPLNSQQARRHKWISIFIMVTYFLIAALLRNEVSQTIMNCVIIVNVLIMAALIEKKR